MENKELRIEFGTLLKLLLVSWHKMIYFCCMVKVFVALVFLFFFSDLQLLSMIALAKISRMSVCT